MPPQSPDTSNAALTSGAPAPTCAADEVPLAQRLLVRPEEAATLLGHTTIRVTMDIYSHVLPDMQREAVLAMERLLTPKPAPPNDAVANR